MPVGAEELTRAGHRVLIETAAGAGSGLSDDEYVRHGAEIVATAEEVYGRAEMIVKVKEPQPASASCCGRARSSSPISTWPPTAS